MQTVLVCTIIFIVYTLQLYPFGLPYNDRSIQATDSPDAYSPAIFLENFTFCGRRISQVYVSKSS